MLTERRLQRANIVTLKSGVGGVDLSQVRPGQIRQPLLLTLYTRRCLIAAQVDHSGDGPSHSASNLAHGQDVLETVSDSPLLNPHPSTLSPSCQFRVTQ